MSDALKSLFEGAGGTRGEAAYVVVEYDKNGEPAKISGLPDFAAECVAAAVAAAREEGVRLGLLAAASEWECDCPPENSCEYASCPRAIRALAADPAALDRIIKGERE